MQLMGLSRHGSVAFSWKMKHGKRSLTGRTAQHPKISAVSFRTQKSAKEQHPGQHPKISAVSFRTQKRQRSATERRNWKQPRLKQPGWANPHTSLEWRNVLNLLQMAGGPG